MPKKTDTNPKNISDVSQGGVKGRKNDNGIIGSITPHIPTWEHDADAQMRAWFADNVSDTLTLDEHIENDYAFHREKLRFLDEVGGKQRKASSETKAVLQSIMDRLADSDLGEANLGVRGIRREMGAFSILSRRLDTAYLALAGLAEDWYKEWLEKEKFHQQTHRDTNRHLQHVCMQDLSKIMAVYRNAGFETEPSGLQEEIVALQTSYRSIFDGSLRAHDQQLEGDRYRYRQAVLERETDEKKKLQPLEAEFQLAKQALQAKAKEVFPPSLIPLSERISKAPGSGGGPER